jgi:hypothetical protein
MTGSQRFHFSFTGQDDTPSFNDDKRDAGGHELFGHGLSLIIKMREG